MECLDQRRLPSQQVWIACRSADEAAEAIRSMIVRGAPAIGIAAAYGLAVEAQRRSSEPGMTLARLISALESAAERLLRARPTAVNLAWAVERMRRRWREPRPPQEDTALSDSTVSAFSARASSARTSSAGASLVEALMAEAEALDREEAARTRAIADHGKSLLAEMSSVLTHCNTGALATTGVGTALGVIRAAHKEHPLRVYVCETRPYLQGARLTAWELVQEGIPVTLIADPAAGLLLRERRVQAVIVGADRIARNGDVVNKIGTYALAVLAREHGIPFYVAAPCSTLDPEIASGRDVEIEIRSEEELFQFAGHRIAPEGVEGWNPSFDLTPASLVTAIVTERGTARPPYESTLSAWMHTSVEVRRKETDMVKKDLD